MGYKSLVDSNITLAFNLLKDLATDATLKKSSDTSFNFSSGEMSNNTESLPIKVVILDDDKQSRAVNSIKRQLLFKTRGLGDLNAYDRVDIPDDSGITREWRFGPKINNDGYTILAEIYREV